MIVGVRGEASVGQGPSLSGRRLLHDVSSMDLFRGELKRHEALTECDRHCFSLILFDVGGEGHVAASNRLTTALAGRLRSTDKLGWMDDDRMGALLPYCAPNTALALARDVWDAGRGSLPPAVAIHSYPCKSLAHGHGNRAAYQSGCCAGMHGCDAAGGPPTEQGGVARSPRRRQSPCDSCRASAEDAARLAMLESQIPCPLPLWKRAVDILGSVMGLVLLSPVFLAAAVLVKSVSKGPVFFRQERVGHRGRTFRLWKFRTYEHNVDTTHHERYVKNLINAARDSQGGPQSSMRKLDKAPGIIPFGNVLRKTCIDEIPQLINVFLGEMSLVGPRPSIRYEVQQYADWHKGRLHAIPGMTGLWQVSGKNRLTFNEMVRLDIRYARGKSLWLDMRILLKTPVAIAMQIVDSLRERTFCPSEETLAA